MYQVVKTYGNHEGLSCVFRQWRATHSHCCLDHGYAIGVEFTFESSTLDHNNWCFDFGNMKPMKEWLKDKFDHKRIVAKDDPYIQTYLDLENLGLCSITIVDKVGCEAFAKMIYDKMNEMLVEMKAGRIGRYPVNQDVRLVSVKVFEHGANAALYYGPTENRTSCNCDI